MLYLRERPRNDQNLKAQEIGVLNLCTQDIFSRSINLLHSRYNYYRFEICGGIVTKEVTRIMAGPGTGKTTALMTRIKQRLETGIYDPKRTLLVTFTRISASDLKASLQEKNIPGADDIYAGTLHAFCLGVLHRFEYFSFAGRVPRILMKFENRFFLEDLFGNVKILSRQLKAFEAGWAREQDQEPGWATSPEDQKFNIDLNDWMRFHECMLISEIIPQTLQYFRANPLLPALKAFDYLLVDEYQDLNKAEQSLIKLLSADLPLTIVGDEDQSIYQNLRYSHPEGISQLHEFYRPEPVKDENLDICRRCPQTVVTIANSLISKNKHRLMRQLEIDPTKVKGAVHLVQWNNFDEEAVGIADYVNTRVIRDHLNLGDILILCPRRQLAYKIRDILRNLGHETHSFFSEEILDGDSKDLNDSQAKQTFTLLQLAVNHNDRVALRCWLGFGHHELRRSEYKRLRDYCQQNSRSPFDVLEDVLTGKLSINGNVKGLIERFELLKQRLGAVNGMSIQANFDSLFPVTEEWATPFREIMGTIGSETTLEDIRDRLILEISQPEVPTDVQFIRIMSLHKSKGLSAKEVIITGWIEGLIPARPDDDLTQIEKDLYMEEQRRLFYVAITRTRESLVLSSVAKVTAKLAYKIGAQIRGSGQGEKPTITSRFFGELGPLCPRVIDGNHWTY